MDAALVLLEYGSTMFCWDCRSTLLGWTGNRWNYVNLSRCRGGGDLGRLLGDGVLDDMGLCSDRCKLKEVVCPFGKCGDRVYRGCEKGWGMDGGRMENLTKTKRMKG